MILIIALLFTFYMKALIEDCNCISRSILELRAVYKYGPKVSSSSSKFILCVLWGHCVGRVGHHYTPLMTSHTFF